MSVRRLTTLSTVLWCVVVVHHYVAGHRTETCTTVPMRFVIGSAGCDSKAIMVPSCRGSCRSRMVPFWDNPTGELVRRDDCTCCAPLQAKAGVVTLRCPGMEQGRKMVRLALPMDCACRPCSGIDNSDDGRYTTL
ncbi:neuroblastoma suppressor of tumorigenicity 1-like [Saccoglossus kowalevskii]|uniref:Bursicon n=1 Tax=Saccoglossus kowalevskii TaxID=10224 RepID=A0ABM0M255_SACKO|nr:PREDICTED: neuroblastoma suppressor of tumorigenicity 1-like [Saccoglossus kowalevskii]